MDKAVKSANKEAEQVLEWGESRGIETCFTRAEKLKPCPIGETGACCKVCHMGPCRLVGKNAEEEAKGVCGASLPVVAARNLVRMVAAGTACHGDHGRDMAFTLFAAANGEAKDFKIKDVKKLYRVAGYLNVEFEGRAVNDVARDVATKLIEDFGRQRGGSQFCKESPAEDSGEMEEMGHCAQRHRQGSCRSNGQNDNGHGCRP